MQRSAMVVLGLALLGCKSHGTSATTGSAGSAGGSSVQAPVGSGSAAGSAATGSAGSAATTGSAMTPAAAEAKARAVLQNQIEASKTGAEAMQKTFTDDAVVFSEGKATTADAVTYYGLADNGPDGVQTDKATISKVIAGGNADAVWFYAEVATQSGKETGTTHVVEVASAAQQWKVVAASFRDKPEIHGGGSNREIENATGSDGPLAKLLASPGTAPFAPDAIVVGPTGAMTGGKDALAGLKLEPMTVFQKAREVVTPTWGFAQANLDHPNGDKTDRIAGLVVAVPGAGGAWSVVLAEYVGR